MNNKVSIQIQAVIYHNQKKNLLKTIEHIHNALRTVTDTVGRVEFVYGDASKTPTFSEEEVMEITRRFSDRLQFRYVFFNENTGFGKGQNLLGDGCTADYILIMNPYERALPSQLLHGNAPSLLRYHRGHDGSPSDPCGASQGIRFQYP